MTGILIIFGVCAALGFQQADNLKEQVRILEETIAFWRQFRVHLEKLRATPKELVRMLRRQEAFENNTLACRLEAGFDQNPSFEHNLLGALNECPQLVACGAEPILKGLGDVIGAQDLEAQLAALDSALALLGRQLEKEESRCKQYSGLYQRLGILGGLAVAVVLF